LTTIVDLEQREELANIKNFERLNDGKITPFFLKLAKAPENCSSLSELRSDLNETFATTADRETHVTNYYQDLYKALIIQNPTSIHDFLGETATNPEVLKAKLSDEEKNLLETPLSIAELDFSVNKSKNNRAPGIDGISNNFIKEFWQYFRVPLWEYANCCFPKEAFTDRFRSSKIRLIPKQGDSSKIKNWRHISLLNYYYF